MDRDAVLQLQECNGVVKLLEGNMSKIREILSIISKEDVTNLQALSRKVDISISTLRALIEAMVHQGYLEEVRRRGGCSKCSMNCGFSISKTKIYRLTEKGTKCIKDTSDRVHPIIPF